MASEENLSVTHQRYVSYSEAHYAGNLVDGAFSLARFGDAATHLCILGDGNEGLFAGYSSVEFLAPVRGGDVLEIRATRVAVGRRSRTLEFEARVLCRAIDAKGGSVRLEDPIIATRARGTVVVPETDTRPLA